MFTIKYLGLSSFLIQTKTTAILIDPVFFGQYGNGPDSKRYPNETFGYNHSVNLSELPSIDAIFITHEHEDHFDIRSLNTLDRKTPIYISGLSSIAMKTILKEMKFKYVHTFLGKDKIKVGDLLIEGLIPPLQFYLGDEWDVIPLLVHHRDGCYLTMIDRVVKFDNDYYPKKSLKNKTNKIFYNAIRGLFHISVEELYKNRLLTSKNLLTGPGVSIHSVNKKIKGIKMDYELIHLTKIKKRERKGFTFTNKNIIPLNSNPRMKSAEWKKLHAHLNDFACRLFGTKLFMMLLNKQATDKKKSFYFILRDHKGRSVFQYCLNSNSFTQIKDDQKKYFISCECYAKDLLDVFSGEIEPRMLNLRHSIWSGQKGLETADKLAAQFWLLFHPLRSPDLAIKRYRACVENLIQ